MKRDLYLLIFLSFVFFHCGSDSYPVTGNCEVGQACDDNNLCTLDDTCNEEGQCVGTAKDCSDGVDCTLDDCLTDTGECYHSMSNCVCTKDVDCDDDNLCTTDVCDVESERCSNTPNVEDSCDDGNTCTLNDICDDKGVCSGTPLNCNDDNPCTDDVCNALGKCQNTVNTLNQCEDDNLCTYHDSCQGDGTCAGVAIYCNDGNPCTDDSCDVSDGWCTFTPNVENECNDGVPCTISDTCQSDGTCRGVPKICNDERDCSYDSCDPSTGTCLFNTTQCACLSDADCDDDNDCTSDVCDLIGNKCQITINSGMACDDGNICSLNDECQSDGVCVGNVVDCNDSNPCTDDNCNTDSGVCENVAVEGRPCDDPDLCTINDVCDELGVCAGDPKECDDGNPCTNDSCDITTGECLNPGTWESCDDLNSCTVSDVCRSNGVCSGDPIIDAWEPWNDEHSYLGTCKDTEDFPYDSIQANLYPSGDVDSWYLIFEDTAWGALKPRIELINIPEGSNYDIRLWIRCYYSTDAPILSCSPQADCDSNNESNQNEVVQIDSVNCPGTTDETLMIDVTVTRISGPWTCSNYTLRWGDT